MNIMWVVNSDTIVQGKGQILVSVKLSFRAVIKKLGIRIPLLYPYDAGLLLVKTLFRFAKEN